MKEGVGSRERGRETREGHWEDKMSEETGRQRGNEGGKNEDREWREGGREE